MARIRRPVDALVRLPAPVTALLLVGLLGLGAGTLVLARSLPDDGAAVPGHNQPVDRGAGDFRDLRANNSPSLARSPLDPANLALANRVDKPRFSCALHVSADGGRTWQPREVPFPDGEEAPPRCYAPDVAFDSKGTLFVSFATLAGPGNVPNAVWLTTSADQGRTLAVPRRVLGPLAFQTRLVADPVVPGRLHLSYVQAASVGTLQFPTTGNPVTMVTSGDGGLTWAPPVTVSPPHRLRVVAPSPATGRAGRLYLAYLDLGDDVLDYHGAHEGRGGEPYPGRWSLVLARSTDGGATWDETVVDDAVVPTQRFIVFLPPAPSVAVDAGTGRVYVAFHDGRLHDADVWLWTSGDEGRSFGAPTRVNDNRRGDGTAQYLPKVSVAPGGRLDVVYYDRRADRQNRLNATSFQYSSDGGSSFHPAVQVSDRTFDSRIGFGSERGLADLGSRLALVSGPQGALAVWSDTRAGTPASSKQDLGAAVITVSVRSAWRSPLNAVGIAVVAAAAALAAVVVRTRLRRRSRAPGDTPGGVDQ
ncbi:MAG TPA: sialidase family protein [Acidimicrobiales bacterium]|nr:sialidase family protein [Acidimicrobiales bacterium]